MKKLAFALTIMLVDVQDHSKVSATVLSSSAIGFTVPEKILEVKAESIESTRFESVIYNEKIFVQFRSSAKNGYQVRIYAKSCDSGSWKFSRNLSDHEIPFLLYCDHNREGGEMSMAEAMNFSNPTGMPISNPDFLFDVPKQSMENYFYTLHVILSPATILRSPSGDYSCTVSIELFEY